jgi:DNA polymerase-3 subunit gamma/tau
MQYQVLARKWRPQTFHELVGQEHISRTLLNALESGRVAHAFLFSGPRGSGKTTTARILAKALNCHEGKPGEPCGRCVACTEIAAGNCLDVLEIDAASNRGIDEIRELKEKVRYRPARDKNKIFIIDEVHMLTAEAFNALLKTLEEPPPHVTFIMATTEYHKIPATILSRCQQYSFKLISFPLILNRLRQIAVTENVQVSHQALEQVAFSSGGSMRDAMSALDQIIAFSGDTVRDEDVTMLLGLIEPAVLGNMVRAIAADEPQKILEIVAKQVESGQDLQNFCRRLLAQFRSMMVLKVGVADPAMLGIPQSLLPDLREQAALFSREDLLRLFDAFLKIEADLKYATQIRFQLEMGLIELAHISKMRPLEEVIHEFRELMQAQSQVGPASKPVLTVAPVAGLKREIGVPTSPSRAAPALAPMGSAPAAHLPETPLGTPPPEISPTVPVSQGKGSPQATAGGNRELLSSIVDHVQKESLVSILQSLSGAYLRDAQVVLEIGSANDFFKRQVRENLNLISEAASAAVGRPVQAAIEGELLLRPSTPIEKTPAPEPIASGKIDPLDRAKREPVVRAFLDMFPGPVKAEEIDS